VNVLFSLLEMHLWAHVLSDRTEKLLLPVIIQVESISISNKQLPPLERRTDFFASPFMAPNLPERFVPRPQLYESLLQLLLSADQQAPIAITTALHFTMYSTGRTWLRPSYRGKIYRRKQKRLTSRNSFRTHNPSKKQNSLKII
jgi:hypothetical protein